MAAPGTQDPSIMDRNTMNAQIKGQQEKTQFRTVQQQEKYDNALQKQKRESGLQSNRSRSTSRHNRRNRINRMIDTGKTMMTASLTALEEADANGELDSHPTFERIGPDSTSMDGPVTKARAERGEIPLRGTNPEQRYKLDAKPKSELDEADGLKLKVVANLEVEIELKASIRGDLTLSLL